MRLDVPQITIILNIRTKALTILLYVFRAAERIDPHNIMWVSVSSSFCHKSYQTKMKPLPSMLPKNSNQLQFGTATRCMRFFNTTPWRARNPFWKRPNAEKGKKNLQDFKDFKNNHAHKNENQCKSRLGIPFDFSKFSRNYLNMWVFILTDLT